MRYKKYFLYGKENYHCRKDKVLGPINIHLILDKAVQTLEKFIQETNLRESFLGVLSFPDTEKFCSDEYQARIWKLTATINELLKQLSDKGGTG